MRVGDKIKILIGPHKGMTAEILKIENNSGAINGWYSVRTEDGRELLYAGEEISSL